MKNTVLLIILFFSIILKGQDLSIGNSSMVFTDPGRNGRKIPVEVFYPADSAGNNVAVTEIHEGKFREVQYQEVLNL